MPIYISKNVGLGIRVGTRIGGGGQKPVEGWVWLMIIFGIGSAFLCTLITESFAAPFITMIVVLIIGSIVAILAGVEKEKKERYATVMSQVQEHMDKVQNGKALATRLSNLTKAISLLEGLRKVKLGPQEAASTEDLLYTLGTIQKVLPVCDALDKAERAEFKGQKRRALDCYLDALLHCRREKLTDLDLEEAGLTHQETDSVITIAYIERNATALGWEGGAARSVVPQPTDADMMVDCPGCSRRLMLSDFVTDSDNTSTCPYCQTESVPKMQ